MRKLCQKFDGAAVFRGSHFGPILPDERPPLSRSRGCKGQFHDWDAGGKIREPDIIPVLGSKFGFGNAPRRTPHGSDAEPFIRCARSSETNDADGHDHLDITWERDCFPQRVLRFAAWL